MYKLKSNKSCYISATKRKYFKYALDWVLDMYKNNKDKKAIINACTVNKIHFVFDFDNLLVHIKSNIDDRFYKYELMEV